MRVQTLAEEFVEELDRRWAGRQMDDEVPPECAGRAAGGCS